MSREIRVYLVHMAVYWKCVDTDSNGEPIYASPIEIRCRIEDHAQQIFDKDGRALETKARIYTEFLMNEKDAIWTPPEGKVLRRKFIPGSLLARLDQTNVKDPYLNDANEIRKNYNMMDARGIITLFVSFT